MVRFFFLLSFLIVMLYASPAMAQIEGDGGVNGKWCYGETCFQDVGAACDQAMAELYPGRAFLLLGVELNSQVTASCAIDNDRARATGLFIGTPSVFRVCPSGTVRDGNICTSFLTQLCYTCDYGGERHTAGNTGLLNC